MPDAWLTVTTINATKVRDNPEAILSSVLSNGNEQQLKDLEVSGWQMMECSVFKTRVLCQRSTYCKVEAVEGDAEK
jgi:hypothetical protein